MSETPRERIARELQGLDPRWARPRCGKPMPIGKEPCGRLPGHTTPCRSAYALDNALRARKLRYVPVSRA